MHDRKSAGNLLWVILLLFAATFGFNACSDTNNVSGPTPLSPNALLSTLTVIPGTLQPVFSSGVANYAVDVLNTVTSVTVTATPKDAKASMKINGQTTSPGQARTITLGVPGSSTPIPIVVTAEDGSQNTYIVTVTRAALTANNSLQSLTVSPGPLAPVFNPSTTSYTVDVASGVAAVTVTAQAQDAGAAVSINGGLATNSSSQSVPLGAPGSNTNISIVVEAANGNLRTYLVTVNRAALGGNNNLQTLTVTPGSLSPAFLATTTIYAVAVASGVASVTVAATAQDAGATVSINNETTTSLLVPLEAAGSSTPISIEVTAPSGSPKTYTIFVNRAAQASNNNLSALSVTGQTLAPPFAPGTTSYTVDVASTVTQVTVSATKSDPNAVMSGSVTAGAGQATGQATIPLNGAGGPPTSISITVTAPNGNSKLYTITVNRAAALSQNNDLSALVVSAGALIPGFDAGILIYIVTAPNTTTDTTITATVADSTATLTINGSPATSGVTSGSIALAVGPNSIPIVVTAEDLSTKTYTVTITREP